MPYVPPNAFVDGYVIEALPITQNFKELSDYINSAIAVTDIEDDSVQTRHIIRPSFFQITGTCIGSYLQTGGIITAKLPAHAISMDSFIQQMPVTYNGFISKQFSSEYDTSATPVAKSLYSWRIVPKTGMTFWVESASRVHIEYCCELASPDCHTGTAPVANKACISIDGEPKIASLVMWTECDLNSTYSQDNMRRTFSTFYDISLTRGWHSCGLVAGLGSNIAFVGATNALVEIMNFSNA